MVVMVTFHSGQVVPVGNSEPHFLVPVVLIGGHVARVPNKSWYLAAAELKTDNEKAENRKTELAD